MGVRVWLHCLPNGAVRQPKEKMDERKASGGAPGPKLCKMGPTLVILLNQRLINSAILKKKTRHVLSGYATRHPTSLEHEYISLMILALHSF
jgi:hypothetical protein